MAHMCAVTVAPGGLAEILVGGMRGLSGDSRTRTPLSGRESVGRFEAGAPLPECPTCGPATGWDFITGTVDGYRRERMGRQQSIFATLGIDNVPRRRRRRWWWPFRRD
jgi:hypothetical protein